MAQRIFLALFLTVASTAAQTTPPLPDTPAGHTFKAFMTAFNSGDLAQIQSYCRTYADPANPDALTSPDDLMGHYSASGGFDVLEVLTSEPQHLAVIVKDHRSGSRAVANLDVKPGDPAIVADMQVLPIPPTASAAELTVTLDAAMKARVIDGALAKLNEFYVSPELAGKMATAIRARQKNGEFDSITSASAFATTLTADLRDVSHDKHLVLYFSPAPLPDLPDSAPPSPEDLAANRKRLEQSNCGFEKVEVLPGNIGYLKFNAFPPPDYCGPTAIAAMNFLANADALIFDLRGNGGGDPKMIQLICTYLFAEPTHLNDAWERKSGETQQYWTLSYVTGKRLDTQPVYVLTSHQTFSAAEEFTYDLRNLKRATVVGETTGGGAHMVRGERLDPHFLIGVPFTRAINPVSKTDWEGVGVIPDVKVAADDALSTAEKLATEKLTPNH